MRRDFAQVLKEGKIDLKNEYSKLYDLFYRKDSRDDISLADMVSNNFIKYYFRGTCLTLEEFDRYYGFRFVEQPQNFDINYLVSFMEYIYNFIIPLEDRFLFRDRSKSFYIQHILKVVELIGYNIVNKDGLLIFIPKDNNAISVSESECIPANLSYKVLEYNHHSMKGNIESKKDILLKLSYLLEAKRKKLSEINSKFTSDLFQLFNTCNIRHNNKDSASTKYCKYVAEMQDDELENTYDEIYQMCLLAFMQLEHADRKEWLEDTKNNIVNVK